MDKSTYQTLKIIVKAIRNCSVFNKKMEKEVKEVEAYLETLGKRYKD